VTTSLYKRFQRLQMLNKGIKLLICPKVDCDYCIMLDDGKSMENRVVVCDRCGGAWCTRCNKSVGKKCCICEEGLTEVVDAINVALSEAAGK
jgi:hypothetical protein